MTEAPLGRGRDDDDLMIITNAPGRVYITGLVSYQQHHPLWEHSLLSSDQQTTPAQK